MNKYPELELIVKKCVDYSAPQTVLLVGDNRSCQDAVEGALQKLNATQVHIDGRSVKDMSTAIRQTKVQVERHLRRLDLRINDRNKPELEVQKETKGVKRTKNLKKKANTNNLKQEKVQQLTKKEEVQRTDAAEDMQASVADQHDGHDLLQIVDK